MCLNVYQTPKHCITDHTSRTQTEFYNFRITPAITFCHDCEFDSINVVFALEGMWVCSRSWAWFNFFFFCQASYLMRIHWGSECSQHSAARWRSTSASKQARSASFPLDEYGFKWKGTSVLKECVCELRQGHSQFTVKHVLRCNYVSQSRGSLCDKSQTAEVHYICGHLTMCHKYKPAAWYCCLFHGYPQVETCSHRTETHLEKTHHQWTI